MSRDINFPGESAEYRSARADLLSAEMEMRAMAERVAEARRALPPGGLLKKDYLFREIAGGEDCAVKFSELFAPGKNALFLYNFMFAPEMDAACAMCASLLDGLNAQAAQIALRMNFAVVAKNPPAQTQAFADARGWKNLRMLSSAKNTYNADYFGEIDGRQMPMANVFSRGGDGAIRHFWGSEMAFAPAAGEPRHLDAMWPLWAVLDTSPDGRGGGWHPPL
jgi:predicted dithiol-disulfide oxidoreductase (DUF899 family)